MGRIDNGKVRLFTRNQYDWTEKYRPIADELSKLPCKQAFIDGEVCVVSESGVSDFMALQAALSKGDAHCLTFHVFDLLYLDGCLLTKVPLWERKEALAPLIKPAITDTTALQYSDHVEENGAGFFEQACRLNLEGIVSKRAGSLYHPGKSRAWLKTKNFKEDEFVIVGFTASGASEVSSLLLAQTVNGDLKFVGGVGTGFTPSKARLLRAALLKITRKTSPVAGLTLTKANWTKPSLTALIRYSTLTADGHLRHPSFLGVVSD